MKLLAAVAALLILLFGSDSYAQTIRYGNWYGGPTHNESGFNHCRISARYESGITVDFVIYKNWGFTFGLGHPSFNLTKGTSSRVTLRIDNFAPRSINTTAISDKIVATHFPPSRIIYEQFRAGRAFELIFNNGARLAFKLDGTSVAIERLANCVHANVGGVNPYAPPPPPPQPNPPPAVSAAPPPQNSGPANREKVLTLVANIFVQAGLTDMHIMAPEDMPPLLKGFDVAWRGSHLVGVAKYIAPSSGTSAKSITDEVIAAEAKACTGKFLTGVRPEEVQEAGKLRRVFVQCEDLLGTVTNLNYIAFGNAARGYYLIGTITRGGSAKAGDTASADDSIARVALQRVRTEF